MGSERLITVHPRLVSSYILAGVQQTVVDFEPIRDHLCEPARNLITLCQRAERVRTLLQVTQTQLTRLLGDAPERDIPPLLVPSPSLPR